MAGGHAETQKLSAMYDRESQDGWHLQLTYHDMLQLALTKEIGLTKYNSFYTGLSYLQHRTDVVTQLNLRIGLDAGPIMLTHDSNGGWDEKTNTGINCALLRIKRYEN